jgi:AraC-like DNA-binding protein
MTGTPAGVTGTPDPLDAALDRLHLDGAIFLQAQYTEAWAYDSPPSSTLATALDLGVDRLVLFHIVAAGECWICLPDGERLWARQGDVIVLPYGDAHAMGGIEEAERVPVLTLLPMPPWDELPRLNLGAGGARTDVVCGYLRADDPLFDPALRVFPPVFVVRPPPGPVASWVDANIRYALDAGARFVSTRLPELLLVEILRLHLADAPAADAGWVAALRDPVLAPALAALHAQPDRRWTVDDLAACAFVSRSVLDERFRRVLGRSPIRYLTEWRMHLAGELLTSTDLGVGEVAHRVGYDAEEAFSRAFKRHHGRAPSSWRAAPR